MLHQLLRPALLAYAIAIPLWVLLRLVWRSRHRPRPAAGRELLLFVLAAYLLGVLLLTLWPLPMTEERSSGGRINLVPLRSTLRDLKHIFSDQGIYYRHLLRNLAGNILLFIPLGLLLPLLFRRCRKPGRVVLAAFLFSAGIELAQGLSRSFGNYRAADVDDVLLNTAGALVGVVLFHLTTGGPGKQRKNRN